jgi:holo-[acyl-carrier protein] synthase
MPPRLFPYPLRIGTDVCNVSRLRRIFATKNRHGQPYMLHKFLKKVLTQPERIYFEDRFGQSQEVMTKLEAVSEYLAGR